MNDDQGHDVEINSIWSYCDTSYSDYDDFDYSRNGNSLSDLDLELNKFS